jgi:PAS domain S-box-containing protein
LDKTKILIVEDEYLLASYLSFSLAEMGFDVPRTVSTGEESIPAAEEIHPDIILMDIALPGRLSGIDAANEIQSRFNIPVIFLTGSDDLDMVKLAGESHPYGYLLKPIRSVELYSSIVTALHRHSLETLLTESEKKYRLVVENINEGLWVIDNNSVTTFVNKRLAEMLGYTSEEMIGQDIFCFMDQDEAKNIRNNSTRLYQGEIDQTDVSFIRKDGSTIYTHLSTGPIISEKGEYVGAVSGVIDMTDRRNAENEIIRLNRHIINLQEEERQKVSKDLHDSVGQTLLAAKINFEMFRKDPERHAECFDIGIDFIGRSSNELREIHTNLYPSILREFGLEDTIRWHAENTLNKTGIDTEIEINISRALPHDLETAVYRIIQELFSNILKHSKARQVYLDLSTDYNILSLTIKDDGIGIREYNDESHSLGNGLVNIRQRVKTVNGSVTITSGQGEGTVVEIGIPLK